MDSSTRHCLCPCNQLIGGQVRKNNKNLLQQYKLYLIIRSIFPLISSIRLYLQYYFLDLQYYLVIMKNTSRSPSRAIGNIRRILLAVWDVVVAPSSLPHVTCPTSGINVHLYRKLVKFVQINPTDFIASCTSHKYTKQDS